MPSITQQRIGRMIEGAHRRQCVALNTGIWTKPRTGHRAKVVFKPHLSGILNLKIDPPRAGLHSCHRTGDLDLPLAPHPAPLMDPLLSPGSDESGGEQGTEDLHLGDLSWRQVVQDPGRTPEAPQVGR